MNTEPPEGDDLQRMLVSMKQHVLEQATPRSSRRRGRTGVVIGVVALLALGTATGAVALTLSQQDRPVAAPAQTQEPAPAPSATTPSSAPITGRPTPTPTRTPTPTPRAASVPDDCRALVPASDYERFFGATPLVQTSPLPGETIESEVRRQLADPLRSPLVAPTMLGCLWRDPRADITALSVTVGTGTPEQLAEVERETFADWSPTCDERDGIRTCRAQKLNPQYGTDWARTTYVRGDTWVSVDQSNFPTNGLLPAIVGQIWGD